VKKLAILQASAALVAMLTMGCEDADTRRDFSVFLDIANGDGSCVTAVDFDGKPVGFVMPGLSGCRRPGNSMMAVHAAVPTTVHVAWKNTASGTDHAVDVPVRLGFDNAAAFHGVLVLYIERDRVFVAAKECGAGPLHTLHPTPGSSTVAMDLVPETSSARQLLEEGLPCH
jgi:hypothetical protein